jgi:5'-methylthioadenosine/S-adenosylhomocysteine nucleosidase
MGENTVDILIMTALDEELQALQELFLTKDKILSKHSSTYYIGDVGSYSVALMSIFGMGNSAAAIKTTQAIRELEPSFVFMFGIAGGVGDEISLSDVIVSTTILYYEGAKIKSGRKETRPQSIQADRVVLTKLQNFSAQNRKPYQIKFGPFAAGEKVIADSNEIEKLRKFEPKLLGVEMESFGVALAANEDILRPRFIAIRGVSDHADEEKDDSFREKALQNAADFIYSFLLADATLPSNKIDLKNETDNFIAIHHVSLDRRSSLASLPDKIPLFKKKTLQELEIDQSDFYKRGTLFTPSKALDHQKYFYESLDSLIQKHPEAEIGYFGLAHIPFIFHLGYEANIREVQLFTTHRQTREWKTLSTEEGTWENLIVENIPDRANPEIEEIVLRMSISYPVLMEQVEEVFDTLSLPILHITVDKPIPDLVIYEKQLDEYAETFHKTLAEIRKLYPRAKSIHLFYSGPPTLAFRCGQQINKTIDPDIIVYNFSQKDTPNYGWAVNISRGEVLEFRKFI